MSAALPERGGTISTESTAGHFVSSPTDSPSEPLGAGIAICRSEWGGLFTQCIVASAVLTMPLPPSGYATK